MKKLSLYIYTALLFGLLLYNKAQASELFGVIGQEHVYENQSVTVSWYLNSQEQPINSLDLKLSYSTNSRQLHCQPVGQKPSFRKPRPNLSNRRRSRRHHRRKAPHFYFHLPNFKTRHWQY